MVLEQRDMLYAQVHTLEGEARGTKEEPRGASTGNSRMRGTTRNQSKDGWWRRGSQPQGGSISISADQGRRGKAKVAYK